MNRKTYLITIDFDINTINNYTNHLIKLCNDIIYHKTIIINYDITNFKFISFINYFNKISIVKTDNIINYIDDNYINFSYIIAINNNFLDKIQNKTWLDKTIFYIDEYNLSFILNLNNKYKYIIVVDEIIKKKYIDSGCDKNKIIINDTFKLSKKKILIKNIYPGHLEVIESIIIKFIPKLWDIKFCNIDIELFDYSIIYDKSKKPDQFINYMNKKYNNVYFQKNNIEYDFIIDNTIIGSKSPTVFLKSNFITNKDQYLKGNYPKDKNIIISDSEKHYYISHRVEEEFFKNIKNVYYLTPLCKNNNYFIPSILPEINKKTTDKLICAVQGNLQINSRNFKSLIPLLKKYDNIYIKLIGRGFMPDCLEKYAKRIILCNNLEWNEYHKAFEDVYCILPLIDKSFKHNYFRTTFTSSISYVIGYNLKCFYFKTLHEIYGIKNSIIYDSNNMVQQFQKVIDSFLYRFT